jgi:hypothetical protein
MPLPPQNPRYFLSFAKRRKAEGEKMGPMIDEIKQAAADQMERFEKGAGHIRHFLDEQDTEEGRVSSASPAPGETTKIRRLVGTGEILRRAPQP